MLPLPSLRRSGSALARAAESARTAITGREVFDNIEAYLQDRHDDQLRNAIEWLNRETVLATIPSGYEELSLVIRIDQADQIAQYDAMFMAKPRAGKNDGGIAGI